MVKIIDKKNTYIDKSVKISKNVIIYPNVYLQGNTIIEDGTVIYPNTIIKDSSIGNDCEIGPNAYIREESNIANNVKIGFSVEIKNSIINDNTKISHLTYIGDSIVGKEVNIGASCVTANYDGVKKNKTIIEDNCFIGSGVILVAPVKIMKNSFIAAGSTFTKDLPEYSFGIARERETIKKNKYKEGKF